MTNKLALAAHEVSRTNHTSHATCIPRKRPKAACAYRYGPPVWAKREDTSQKQAMMTPMASAATMTANMLARPSSPESIEGSPKTPLPIMQFTISAAILQRPMARTRPSLEVCGGLISGTRVCITNYGAYGNALSGAPFDAVTFARTKVTHRITKAHARGTSTRLTLPMRWLSGKPNGLRRHGRPSSPNRARDRRPAHHSARAELRSNGGSKRSRIDGSAQFSVGDGAHRNATRGPRSDAALPLVLCAGGEQRTGVRG